MTALGVVPVEGLAAALGFAETMATPLSNRVTPYPAFRMERHDAPVLAYLYRNHAPLRHLEFGTWEGFGATLCARSCGARIWTLNLPGGERHAETGRPLYQRAAANGDAAQDSAGAAQTDAGAFIGRLYREAGFAGRVEQILADSTQWDHSSFGDGFFDSVLIDGGHTPDVVASDTAAAIRLLRPGGLCLWHDFCPAPAAMAAMPATRGVVRALVDHFADWAPMFAKAFWIRRTFLLAGVRSEEKP